MDSSEPSSFFLSMLKGGSLSIAHGDRPAVSIFVEGDRHVIDVADIPITLSKKSGIIKQLSQAKSLAGSLRDRGLTLEVRLHGDPVLRLGREANPMLTRIVTMSGAIEITSIRKLKTLNSML